MKRITFVLNPIAGMGGRVGLKGTDGVVETARAAGAEPVAPERALSFLKAFRPMQTKDPSLAVRWLTCSGPMGADALANAGVPSQDIEIIHEVHGPTTAEDTKAAARAAWSARADLFVFCGGDGTARDIVQAIDEQLPIVGVPAGVKMHSGVFAVSPTSVADILAAYLRGELREGPAEVLDLDEDAYREGHWKVRLYSTAKTLVEPNLVQAGKMMSAEVADEAIIAEVSEHFEELFEKEPEALFLLGPGSTIQRLATRLRLEKTLLGIDAVVRGTTIAKDLNEKRILDLLDHYPIAKLVVSPIGAQGFVLGRGNLQVSPAVFRRIGVKNLLVVATPSKLNSTPVLRVDTGDGQLDEEFRKKEYLFVLIGYRTTKLHPIKG